jgi:2,4-dienoyl-CoA reductase-like NADH-dependent reductase (Old Yellow Enzyme family)
MRFALEVARSVRASWPAHKPLFMRLSVDDDAGWGPAESVALARELKDLRSRHHRLQRWRHPRPAAVSSAPLTYGYQVPFARAIRQQGGVGSMAVGLIVHHDQAEAILQSGDADLIALAREMLYNPNWAMDAAQKMAQDPGFSMVPDAYGWWLGKRAAAMPQLRTSTQEG